MKLKLCALIVGALIAAGAAQAQQIVFNDPRGDDDGPGTYVYPVDPVYTKRSFDLERVTLTPTGDELKVDVRVGAPLKDPYRTGAGYSLQLVFIFIDTDNTPGSGHAEGVPGLNIDFDPAHAWDKVIVLAPTAASRVAAEVRTKMERDVDDVVATTSLAFGSVISANVPMAQLGAGDPATWSYQVVMQSFEGFPTGRDLLTRRVNEYAGQHRFGGGDDSDCDPHVLDILAAEGRGAPDEIAAQQAMLGYECSLDGESVRRPLLKMLRPPA